MKTKDKKKSDSSVDSRFLGSLANSKNIAPETLDLLLKHFSKRFKSKSDSKNARKG